MKKAVATIRQGGAKKRDVLKLTRAVGTCRLTPNNRGAGHMNNRDLLKAILLTIVIETTDVAWWIIKRFLILAVVVGIVAQVISDAPGKFPSFNASVDWVVSSVVWAFETIEQAWLPVGLAFVFFWVWSVTKKLQYVTSHVTQTKVGMVALLNYLQICVETDGMKKLQQEDISALFKSWKSALFWRMVLGDGAVPIIDDTLSAQPVRQGSKITLAADIRSALAPQRN